MTGPAGDGWRIRSGVLTREVPGGLLALAPGAPAVVLLAGTAAELWELLADRPDHGAQLAAELRQRYPDADPGQIDADVRHALDELASLGLAGRGERTP